MLKVYETTVITCNKFLNVVSNSFEHERENYYFADMCVFSANAVMFSAMPVELRTTLFHHPPRSVTSKCLEKSHRQSAICVQGWLRQREKKKKKNNFNVFLIKAACWLGKKCVWNDYLAKFFIERGSHFEFEGRGAEAYVLCELKADKEAEKVEKIFVFPSLPPHSVGGCSTCSINLVCSSDE